MNKDMSIFSKDTWGDKLIFLFSYKVLWLFSNRGGGEYFCHVQSFSKYIPKNTMSGGGGLKEMQEIDMLCFSKCHHI